MIAWFNGELMPLEGISYRATDRGFLLGDGFFETLAANHGKPVHFQAHMDRFQKTATFFDIQIPFDADEIEKAIEDITRGSGLSEKRASIRMTVSRGSGPRGLLPPTECHPSLMIACFPVPKQIEPAELITVHIRRNETSPTTQFKTLCYLDNIHALQQARKKGGNDAVMLNSKGHVAETTVSNLFLIKDNALYTPKISDGCLPGIMRALVIDAAQEIGLIVHEDSLEAIMLETCEAAFMTNSTQRLRPVAKIDGRLLSDHPFMDQLKTVVIAKEAPAS